MQEFQHLQVVSLEISKLELSLFFVSFLFYQSWLWEASLNWRLSMFFGGSN